MNPRVRVGVRSRPAHTAMVWHMWFDFLHLRMTSTPTFTNEAASLVSIRTSSHDSPPHGRSSCTSRRKQLSSIKSNGGTIDLTRLIGKFTSHQHRNRFWHYLDTFCKRPRQDGRRMLVQRYRILGD
ncbi:hypothetical protein, variant [Exophiala xenobiotica]|uniref:Uncharacterized protein n=1 Tax=Exophiala xenobiotica TaxID=348802 RepID=A0A0D2BKS2_9EURO|nr:hypothetical protein, variant [Exophiala xenobiotica]KIW53101.1 hypothetical protein, variant [Exophiala xenobiotica]